MMRSLFLQAPSFDGFDGGAGSRCQAPRETPSFFCAIPISSTRRFSSRWRFSTGVSISAFPKIAAIVGEMVRSPEAMKRRLQEGVEFFRFLKERREVAL